MIRRFHLLLVSLAVLLTQNHGIYGKELLSPAEKQEHENAVDGMERGLRHRRNHKPGRSQQRAVGRKHHAAARDQAQGRKKVKSEPMSRKSHGGMMMGRGKGKVEPVPLPNKPLDRAYIDVDDKKPPKGRGAVDHKKPAKRHHRPHHTPKHKPEKHYETVVATLVQDDDDDDDDDSTRGTDDWFTNHDVKWGANAAADDDDDNADNTYYRVSYVDDDSADDDYGAGHYGPHDGYEYEVLIDIEDHYEYLPEDVRALPWENCLPRSYLEGVVHGGNHHDHPHHHKHAHGNGHHHGHKNKHGMVHHKHNGYGGGKGLSKSKASNKYGMGGSKSSSKSKSKGKGGNGNTNTNYYYDYIHRGLFHRFRHNGGAAHHGRRFGGGRHNTRGGTHPRNRNGGGAHTEEVEESADDDDDSVGHKHHHKIGLKTANHVHRLPMCPDTTPLRKTFNPVPTLSPALAPSNSTSSEGGAPVDIPEGTVRILVESYLDYGFFEETMVRAPTQAEIDGVLAQTSAFYTQILSARFPNLNSFQATFVDSSTDLSNPGGNPVRIDFDANAFFEEGTTIPQPDEVFQAMEDADYQVYITEFVWMAEPMMGLFESTQRTGYNARVSTEQVR